MAGPKVSPAPAALLFTLFLAAPVFIRGDYLVTTPRQWISPGTSQVCVFVQDPAAPAGSLNLTLVDGYSSTPDPNSKLGEKVFDIPAGKYEQCHDITVNKSESYSVTLLIEGKVGGVTVKDKKDIILQRNNDETFIQTDRYLYRPGEKVQFRVLTITGNKLEVSKEEYSEIYVTTPSRNRIAQWKNVTNTDGLVHLDFQLADEPEEGSYRIHVKTQSGSTTQTFKVEEFVLPRFEVKIKPPAYALPTDEKYSFQVCANYTFGQPVKGNLSFTIHNQQGRKCRKEVTHNVTIDGCIDLAVTSEEMQVIDCSVYSLEASATVDEAGTGVQLGGKQLLSITRSVVNFKPIYKDEFMKPNLPFTVKLRAELPDGTPASGVPVEVCAAGRCNNDTTALDGILNMVLPNYDANSVRVKTLNCRASTDSTQYTENIEHYFSPSNSSLLIVAQENTLECSPAAPKKHRLSVLFSARDQPTATLTVQIVSRGIIQHTATQEVTLTAGELPVNAANLVEPMPAPIEGTVRGVLNLDVDLPPTASPKARVLVWYTRADGEVVSDVRELQVKRCLANNVTLGWSTPKAQPGDTASLTLGSEPNSVCSLGVVDRSTELLTKEPDPITLERLFDFADRFTIYKYTRSQINDYDYCNEKHRPKPEPLTVDTEGSIEPPILPPIYRYYSSYVDALKMFSDAGVYVITDLTVETRPCEKEEYHHHVGFGGGGPFFESAVNARPPPQAVAAVADTDFTLEKEGVDQADSGATLDAPRTDFPETWLWDIVVVPETGSQEQQVTLPDTITQWVGKAICVHPQAGVGISDKQSIITFTPFFIDLTLPPTVKRGEILPVKMSVFNYHSEALPVRVTLEDSTEYEILEEAGAPGVRGKRSACIPPNDKAVLTVRVRPSEIADVNLTVSAAVDAAEVGECGAGANSPQRTDALIKPIKVEAEGFLREKTWTKYVCSADDFAPGQTSLTLESWDLVLPDVLVEGSARGWVTAVGDLLALSLENLGSLIRMPYGCGEQNMINFAPNIYILRYLNTTRQTTPEATEKLLRYMNTGYQRELLYRRSDGSYSAFGNADDSGSTWLTAFVLKSFAQARDNIQVDEEKLNETRSWLMKQQDTEGCFITVGKVLHKGMQGGLSNSKTPASLTAYVLVALIEADEDLTSKPVNKAVQCLTSDTSIHPYTLATKAYALALAGRPEAAAAVTALLEAAVDSKDEMYWKLPERQGNSQAAALETAGYAILALLTLDAEKNEPQARKIVKWITTQRNGQGGFYSTQDTIVALQALATFESYQHQGPLSVTATVTAEGLTHSFSINDNNKLLQQLVTLPTLPTNVTLGMEGEGCAVMQAVLRYNIPTPEPSDAFDLTVNTNTAPDHQCVTKRITACASYRLPDNSSNMVVIEVDLISGYIPEKEDLKKLLKEDKNLKRYEVDGSKVNFYVNELTAKDTCVNFRVIREVDVEEVKPGTVVVYDYYQPEFSVSKRYTLPPNDECR
ncbi:pregnancy zone protein-like isoform X3 [Eriocheir sinensis]|uniref:pregnancy zone protein-like isoform X3 n=1 Tax=Eriocheir sinensis TaxID=95602 RepID=UPI0021C9C217|nr:pregnancy zone protein-like isoform X3 [Eriocheir sinensis]